MWVNKLVPCMLAALAIQAASLPTQPRALYRRQDDGMPSAKEILEALTKEEKQLLIESGYDTKKPCNELTVDEIQDILDATVDPTNNNSNNSISQCPTTTTTTTNNNNNNVVNENLPNGNNNDATTLTPEELKALEEQQLLLDQAAAAEAAAAAAAAAAVAANGGVDNTGTNVPPVNQVTFTAQPQGTTPQQQIVSDNLSPASGSNPVSSTINNPTFQAPAGGAVAGAPLQQTVGTGITPAQGGVGLTPQTGAAVADRVKAAVKPNGQILADAGLARGVESFDAAGHLAAFPKAGPITKDKSLKQGEALEGPCGFRLELQKDQNMVISDAAGRVVWQTKTTGLWPWAAETLMLEVRGGTLQMKSSARPQYDKMWSSKGKPTGVQAMLGPDGNLVLLDASGAVAWTSGVPKDDLCSEKKDVVVQQQRLAGLLPRRS